jgi:hypothetical protein
MLKPGGHNAVISPNDACCEETKLSFVVHKAEPGSESQAETIPLAAKFRPSTVSVSGAPAGGQIVCGALGTFTASPTTVTLQRASASAECDVIGPDGPKGKTTVTLNAGRTQSIPWP